MKATFVVVAVTPDGEQEVITMCAVADEAGANSEWAEKPWGNLEFGITNPEAKGKFVQGQKVHLDIVPA